MGGQPDPVAINRVRIELDIAFFREKLWIKQGLLRQVTAAENHNLVKLVSKDIKGYKNSMRQLEKELLMSVIQAQATAKPATKKATQRPPDRKPAPGKKRKRLPKTGRKRSES